ncbi:AAA family ATPase [Thiorhodospira sibirica]|uniref:AAA family ATPase n=1 Tax=Thiorhodospira sibirica TaxID=154347 RepID=UPI0011125704|nr:AAA family ATPase [Thiorhodospira sibirica]
MSNKLEELSIKEFYGSRNIEVSIQDNTLILVGENGSGKITFLRILFYLLSDRWISLAQFKFESLSVTISGKRFSVVL